MFNLISLILHVCLMIWSILEEFFCFCSIVVQFISNGSCNGTSFASFFLQITLMHYGVVLLNAFYLVP